MSQNDLAESLNISRQSISKWETDGATPDLDKLVGMSEIFGVTLDELIKGEISSPSSKASTDETIAATQAGRATVHAPHRLAGIILLCFGALLSISLLVLGGGLFSLLVASPFWLCGIICLYIHQRMQNRYVGDIGDFGKLGLLRQLHKTGLSIGVNWYLTPDETHNGDGWHK